MITKHQEDIFNKALNSEDKIVRFEGEGGTGKSFTINQKNSKNKFAITATTNKALTHHESPTGTIHSFLGFSMFEGKLKARKGHTVEYTKILIVDESSMLTRELLTSILYNVSIGRISKVILVGDPIQLQIDPFLDLSRFKTFELTQQMRQIEENALKRNLKRLRYLIENKKAPEKLEYDDSVVRYENHAEFIKAYKESKKHKYILAYRNQTVRTYNRRIVKDMHKKDDEYNVGDMLVALNACYDERKRLLLRNREEFLIDEISDEDGFWRINRDIKIPKTKTWLNNQIDKYKERNWSKYYSIKEQYVFAHHSYAGTVHSAQGSTFDEVFIDVSDFSVPNDPIDQTLLRLMYVGLSRARIRAHIFVGTQRDWDAFKN